MKIFDVLIHVLTAAMLAAMVCEALDKEEVQGRGQPEATPNA